MSTTVDKIRTAVELFTLIGGLGYRLAKRLDADGALGVEEIQAEVTAAFEALSVQNAREWAALHTAAEKARQEANAENEREPDMPSDE